MSDLRTSLEGVFDPARLSFDEADRVAHSRDWSPRALLALRSSSSVTAPFCVARPASRDDVVVLLTWAEATGTPVVPYGEGSSVVQGITGTSAPLCIDMGEMWEVIDLDTKSRLVTVQAGVTGPQLTGALQETGFMLGHEPQSHDISSVGGWVATRACGQLSAKYGGIEDLVAGLEAVLPGGAVVRSKTVPRRSVGPDLMGLMIGSEGTLGIITEVTLRISEIPSERADLALRFDHMADGVQACRRLVSSDLRPTVVRLYDAEDASLFLRHFPEEPQGPLLLLSFDGPASEDRAASARDLLGGEEASPALVEHWWEHRNDAVKEFRTLMAGEGLLGAHGVVDTIEVAGTWSVLRDLYHSMKEELSTAADFAGCHLSHVYPDGACLYYTLGSAAADDDGALATLERWWGTAMRTCLENGGSISHHHGIGRTKAPWLEEELGGWFPILRAVKSAIDPKGIMNPGALGL